MVEFDLFGGHRLALDDGLDTASVSEIDDVFAYLFTGSGPKHFAAMRLNILDQLLEIVIEVVDRVLFDLAGSPAQGLPIQHAGKCFTPPINESVGGALERALEDRILQGRMRTLSKIWIWVIIYRDSADRPIKWRD
jgi:hypothetical protein